MGRAAQRALRQTLRVGPLLAVLISALFLEAVPVIHAHADGESGFYNAACSLSLLATHTGGAPLPILDRSGSRLPELPAPIRIIESSPQKPFVPAFTSRAPPA